MSDAPETGIEKAKRLRAERLAREEAERVVHDPDLIPAIEPSSYEPTTEDAEVDKIVGDLDILRAYRIYSNKSEPKHTTKIEVQVSCPRTDHPDTKPSTSLNIQDNVWKCYGCEDGGDVIALVARAKGILDDSYKNGKNFPDLKREIAADLGFVVRKTIGGEIYVEQVEVESDEDPVIQPGATSTEPAQPGLALVEPTVLYPDEIVDETEQAVVEGSIPTIPWEDIFPVGTFMYEYIKAADKDDLPTEYHIFNGLALTGLSASRRVILADGSYLVYANMFVCHFGPSGMGKSRSLTPAMKVLREALPFDRTDPSTMGVMVAPMPGSPEAMIDMYSWNLYDDIDPKKVIGTKPVTGLNRWDELSGLIGTSNRVGNPLKPILMSFYDGNEEVSTASRGHGTVTARDAYCTLITSTQPRAIRTVLLNSDVDSGFVNRFIFVMGHAKRSIPFGATAADMKDAIDLLKKLHAWSLMSSLGRMIGMSEDALKRFNEFYWDHLEQYKMSDDSIMSRIPLQMKKILLLIAINEKATEITIEHVEKMILIYPYIQATYAYLSGDLGTGEKQEYDMAVLNACQAFEDATGRGASPADIIKRLGSRFDRSAGTVRRALDDLCAVGLLKEATIKPTTGRPTTRYTVAS